MTDAQIIELARLISEGKEVLSWQFYLTLGGLVFLVGALSSFLGSYFHTRGQRFATKTDFQAIVSELKETTRVTEEIRQSISQGGWIEQQYRVTRREKLEDLLRAIHEVQLWLEKERDHAFFDGTANELPNPTYKVSILSGLYFEELQCEIASLNVAIANYHKWIITNKAKYKMARLQGDNAAAGRALQDATDAFADVYKPVAVATEAVSNKAQEIMRSVLRHDR